MSECKWCGSSFGFPGVDTIEHSVPTCREILEAKLRNANLQVESLKQSVSMTLGVCEKLDKEKDAALLQNSELKAALDDAAMIANKLAPEHKGFLDILVRLSKEILKETRKQNHEPGRLRIGGKCDKQYPVDESAYGYCGRDLGHDGSCGRG